MLECDDTQLLLAEFRGRAGRRCPSGTTRTQHSLDTAFLVPLRARCQPRPAATSSLGHLAAFVDGEEHSLQAKMPGNKNDPSGDVCIFTLSFFLSFPLNPTAAKEETMPFVNTDGTTLLLRQICG